MDRAALPGTSDKDLDVASSLILIVEDDPALAHAIERNLLVRGYVARVAATVAEAMAALHAGCPELLLLDIDLPDGSGWEVLRELRAGGHADVPAVVMSALRPNHRLCAELDAVGVLEKPFPMEALIRQVTALLRGAPATATARDGDLAAESAGDEMAAV